MRPFIAKTSIIVIAATGAVLFTGCSHEDDGWIAYVAHDHEITIDSVTVSYAVFTPSSYAHGKARPLVFALHYSGPVPDSIGRDFLTRLVEPALGSLEAVMVAPRSVGPGGWTTDTNEKLVLAVLDSVKANYSIESHRVLVLGYSMGATGAWRFIARYPDLFSAAIPISGMPDPRDPPVVRDQNIFVVHSRADELFPLLWVEEIVYALQFRDVPVFLEVVDGLGHGDVDGFVDPLGRAVPWVRLVWGLPPLG